MLLAKVQLWAAESGGCFPVQGQSYCGSPVPHVAKYDGSDRFKWGKVGDLISQISSDNTIGQNDCASIHLSRSDSFLVVYLPSCSWLLGFVEICVGVFL
jgi:hypothetical protein